MRDWTKTPAPGQWARHGQRPGEPHRSVRYLEQFLLEDPSIDFARDLVNRQLLLKSLDSLIGNAQIGHLGATSSYRSSKSDKTERYRESQGVIQRLAIGRA